MASERLSKLQKWILAESYKLNIQHDESTIKNTSKRAQPYDTPYLFYEHWVYEFFYHFRGTGHAVSRTDEYKKAHVTVIRSVRNLEQKGLITVTRNLGYDRTRWVITGKGVDMLTR